MPASQDSPGDFGSAVDAAAADWYSERHETPQSNPSHENSASEQWTSSHTQLAANDAADAAAPAPPTSQIGSDITAWQTALQSLPLDFKDQPYPTHPLPASLAAQPTIRQIEWNPYRQQGGFVPRTAHDFASLMIFVCGQINPNPCRNCLLRNGPFAKCVVSPPHVLAISTIRHACANCTYQNQYRKCTNEPITEEEMARRFYAKGSTTSRAEPPLPRKPKAQTSATKAPTGARSGRDSQKQQARPQLINAPPLPRSQARLQEQEQEMEQEQQRRRHNPYRHVIRKPSSRSITVESFVDKLRQARAWSPRSRQKVKAEIMQWQAAIATAEAENKDLVTAPGSGSTKARSIPQSTTARLPKSSKSARYIASPVFMEEDIPERDDEDESEMSEDEGETWMGLEGEAGMT